MTSYPCCVSQRHGSSTALCSTAVVMMCLPVWRPCQMAACMAQLSDSVPQEVKYRRSGGQCSAPAITARQPSTAFFISCPAGYWEEGLPK